MRKSIFITFILLISTAVFAQSDSTSIALKKLFPSAKLQWIKHYKGRIDDLSDVAIVLGFDGKFCRGYLTYLRSKEKFLLDGIFDKDSIILSEIDKNKRTTAFIRGVKKDKRIEANWQNFNNTIGGIQLNMVEVLEPVMLPSFCGDNKWIHNYSGKFDEEEVDILIQKGSFGLVRGVGFWKKTGKSFSLKGTFDEQKLSIDVNLKDGENFKLGKMSLRLRSLDEFIGSFILPDGKKIYGTIHRDDDLKVGCTEYADYVASYDITFPKLENEKFDLWMQSFVDEWFRNNLAYINSIRFDNLDNVPEVRNIARAYGWCDVDFYSGDLMSGYMVFGNSWTSFQKERVFIYDIAQGKQLFKEDILKKKIEKGITQNFLYTEPDFKEWAATQNFDNITLRYEGINFSSTSTAYGRQGVTIPYSELSPFLKKETTVWNMANRKK
jgi:hypothetical protein